MCSADQVLVCLCAVEPCGRFVGVQSQQSGEVLGARGPEPAWGEVRGEGGGATEVYMYVP